MCTAARFATPSPAAQPAWVMTPGTLTALPHVWCTNARGRAHIHMHTRIHMPRLAHKSSPHSPINAALALAS